MSCHPHCPTATVFDPPTQVVNDIYDPQLVNVVHTVEVTNSHHCVPVYQHCYQYVVKEEFNAPTFTAPTFTGPMHANTYGRQVRTSGLSKNKTKKKSKFQNKK
ncbi:hypothetical protein Back11_24270 [Paenibacillus baekrokdamisoli]|uniref:Uncharacterized protein n=1 Tax=Paenibacillus baekrokdamisoli TaxID=1712516 RepID=A0A3G9IS02_9BACL|nr:hypothetical protein [Paenibacillus baekrokdamisoli]MBB3070069.1 hypothetical protein [Paenibacillus baekrokdamisoli]BBH21082.1 hypothetical protein Back11_24270 [Paenibacillus baekrokdamisoli]